MLKSSLLLTKGADILAKKEMFVQILPQAYYQDTDATSYDTINSAVDT